MGAIRRPHRPGWRLLHRQPVRGGEPLVDPLWDAGRCLPQALSRNLAVFTDSSRPLHAHDRWYLPRAKPDEVIIMRRFGKPMAVTAAVAFLALGPVTMATAATASPLASNPVAPSSARASTTITLKVHADVGPP